MTDIALLWNDAASGADIAVDQADLQAESGLRTAIIISLFSDRRALADDVLPQEAADRRGWWGDSYATVPGDLLGSRLWLLAREKITPAVLVRAREYALEALAWLLDDQVASAIAVEVEVQRPDRLALAVVITRPEGGDQKFDFVWKAP